MLDTSSLPLAGRVAVVTGAGRGIGRATALGLAAAGASVVVNDLGTGVHGEGIDPGVAELVAEEIRAAGGMAVASEASVATWEGAESIIETAIGEFKSIDILVNNAGIIRDRVIWKMSREDWEEVLRTHLHGTFYCSRLAAVYMRNQQRGSIINFTSTAGLVGNFAQANYIAAKLGIVALTKVTAIDLQKYGVTANCIAPWAVTRQVLGLDPAVQQKRGKKAMELRPEQVVPLIVYLGSEVGRTTSGQIFSVRGREVILFSQPRPLRSIVATQPWTAEDLVEAMPALAPFHYNLDVTTDVFPYEAIT